MRIWSEERGTSTLAVTAAAGFALTVFVLLANLVLLHYARGVVRTAADEAVRHGVVDLGSCQAAAESVIDDLLGGPYGANLTAACLAFGDVLGAEVGGTVPSLIPGISGHSLMARASVVLPDG